MWTRLVASKVGGGLVEVDVKIGWLLYVGCVYSR